MHVDCSTATMRWVKDQLGDGEEITAVAELRGGWTSRMRRLEISGPLGTRSLVLRSFVSDFFRGHADGLLSREAAVLELLKPTPVPAADLIAVDAEGNYCDDPSLLMSMLPGRVELSDDDPAPRIDLLAAQLVAIHRVEIADHSRPRTYQPWTSAETVRVPERTNRPGLWRRAIDGIRQEPPPHNACFLHRDFHPGNVLFATQDGEPRISGVVDWVETSWGPADLDVAHCSTALALLHGPAAGMTFADQYVAAGGRLAAAPGDHLYWRLLDSLAFAPDAEKVAMPWRDVGRSDLTPSLLEGRLEDYLAAVLDHFG
ncbi:aminoglycoside phosphotransferase family protein [Kribbella sp. NPDC051952]|uniref:phosphotransferase family protein n=1 Tax=Kribbella sp. NPDC051952 TaxID=3154851 RepID=UPI00342ACE97